MDDRLQLKLHTDIAACTACCLHKTRTNVVIARGNPNAKVLIVGEGPGADEDKQGLPFVGASGKKLNNALAEAGISQDDVYVVNMVKCRPPNNRKPTKDELAACKNFLAAQILLVSPIAIVLLGATAASLADIKSITKARGKWTKAGAFPTMPTYHPANCFHDPGAYALLVSDLRLVKAYVWP